MLTTTGGRGCNTGRMLPDPAVQLRLAIPEDDAFIVEMARHASVVEDWPLPDAQSEDVRTLLPAAGDVSIVAAKAGGRRVGAVWTLHNEPPLRVGPAGVPLPELCIAVVPDMRGSGVGSALLDALRAMRRNPDRTVPERPCAQPRAKAISTQGFRGDWPGPGPPRHSYAEGSVMAMASVRVRPMTTDATHASSWPYPIGGRGMT